MGSRWKALSRLLHVHTETAPGAVKTSVFLRHLDGGSSNVFESELTALTNPIYDLAQYGIRFVASPSHADALLLTGPLTRNMLAPARAAFRVMPSPKAIITVGDYAAIDRTSLTGDGVVTGIAALFANSYATVDLPDDMRHAVVAHVPGDPPEPAAIIDTLLTWIRSR